MSELVILPAFFRIFQDLVSLRSLFEFFLCLFIARIPVRMVFYSHLAVSFFDLFLACIPANSEYFVIIFFSHKYRYLLTITLEGLITLSLK